MLHRAVSEIGHGEFDGPQISARAREYLQAAGLRPPAPHQGCPYLGGAFLAWLAIQDGLTPPLSPAVAQSWMTWGERLDRPTVGCVLVITGESAGGPLHVGMMVREAPQRYYVVGCNANVVEIRDVAAARVVAARRPPSSSLGTAVPIPSVAAAPITIHVTAAGRSAADSAEQHPFAAASRAVASHGQQSVIDDLDALKRQSVRAIAATAEAHHMTSANPKQWVSDLADLAAEVTSASTVESVRSVIERAKRRMEHEAI